MKILFICEGITPISIVAQPWKHVIEIASRMKKNGLDVELITNAVNSSPEKEVIYEVPIKHVPKKGLFFDIKLLTQVITSANPDIINWHASDIWSFIYLKKLKNKIHKNIVWTLHSGIFCLKDLKNINATDYLRLYKYWNNILNSAIPKFVIKDYLKNESLKGVTTLSRRTAEKLKEYGLTEKMVSTITSGVDVTAFKPYPVSTNDFKILYFGTLSSFRGADTLINAFKLVRKNFPSVQLILLARGTESNKLFKSVKNLPNTQVITSVLSKDELIDSLSSASVIVLPFKFWPQVDCPLTILEAMAMGKAVITTSVGAIPELVFDMKTGIVIPSKNPKTLSEAIIKLINDPALCKRLGENARNCVEHFYDWNNLTEDTLKILSTVSKGVGY